MFFFVEGKPKDQTMKADIKETKSNWTYYEVIGTYEGEEEILFSSYSRKDAIYEKENSSQGWRWDGYKKIKMEKRIVNVAPDREVYPELY